LEHSAEQAFVNEVLSRVLYAQSLVEGATFLGKLGAFLANPTLPSVNLLVHIPDFYPSNYPLTEHEVQAVLHRAFGAEEALVDVMDLVLLRPHMSLLFEEAAAWNKAPLLTRMISEGRCAYPQALVAPLMRAQAAGGRDS
jgi:hypothetical protein